MIDDKIITAEEARQLTKSSIKLLGEKFLKEIISEIRIKASQGCREVWYNDFIMLSGIEALEILGYKVEDMSNQKDGGYEYRISW